MRKVIGIGETVLDIVFKDNKPVEAVPGGSTFNAAVSLGRVGMNVVFVSQTGDDRVGAMTRSFLAANNVDTAYVAERRGWRSPVSLAFLDAANNADYAFYRDANSDAADMELPPIAPDDIVLFGSFYAVNPATRAQVVALLERARSCGAIVYYDVNYRPSHRNDVMRITPNLIENLEYADIVRGSRDDFEVLYRKDSAERVYRGETSFYCPRLVYTDGAQPVTVFSDGGFRHDYPMPATPTVSTIGAGDSFNAGLLYALLRHDIRRDDIERGLSEAQWALLIESATAFSADCCKGFYNCVSEEFARQLRGNE